MGFTFSLALYFIIWWTVLFAVLPFGVRTQDEDGVVVPGTPGSAPTKPRFQMVLAVTTLASCVVFAIAYAVIVYRVVDLDWITPGLR